MQLYQHPRHECAPTNCCEYVFCHPWKGPAPEKCYPPHILPYLCDRLIRAMQSGDNFLCWLSSCLPDLLNLSSIYMQTGWLWAQKRNTNGRRGKSRRQFGTRFQHRWRDERNRRNTGPTYQRVSGLTQADIGAASRKYRATVLLLRICFEIRVINKRRPEVGSSPSWDDTSGLTEQSRGGACEDAVACISLLKKRANYPKFGAKITKGFGKSKQNRYICTVKTQMTNHPQFTAKLKIVFGISKWNL